MLYLHSLYIAAYFIPESQLTHKQFPSQYNSSYLRDNCLSATKNGLFSFVWLANNMLRINTKIKIKLESNPL